MDDVRPAADERGSAIVTTSDSRLGRTMFGIRLIGVVAAPLLLVLLSGCMSAIDDTSAFGFATTPSAKQIAAADLADAPEISLKDGDAAAPAPTDPAGAARNATPGASSSVAALLKPAASEPPARSVADEKAVAAYAGASVAEGDATSEDKGSGDKGKAGGHSLFASLFTDAKTRTPLPNADRTRNRRVILHRDGQEASDDSLPGVDPTSLFEIGQRESANEDALDDVMNSYRVASLVPGLARLAPNGLKVRSDDVDTACFPRKLVSMLDAIGRRFGSQPVITSGYRSPAHNAAVHGATHSEHMNCNAADLVVPGVDHLMVAAYVRSLPDRGGVGTYCHTTAIHVNVGRRRDWNWRCRQQQ